MFIWRLVDRHLTVKISEVVDICSLTFVVSVFVKLFFFFILDV